ncbi:MAG TPA: hypothetical protein VFY71_04840 [Planctomycetota bacterium]|nr:hypothetical protein [Planctomycetota bacterium]
MKSYLLGWLAAAVLCVAVPNLSAQQDKQAQKVVKKTLAGAVKTHGQEVKALVKPATSTLQDTKAAMAAGDSAPGDGVSVLADVLTSLDLSLADTTTASMVQDACVAIDTALAAAGLPLPSTALVATGSVFDKKLARMWKQHARAVKKGRKSAQSVLKTMTKLGEPAALRTPDTQLPAWAPGFFDAGPPLDVVAQLVAPPTLQLTALVGHSDGDDPGDGSLEIAGFTLLTDDVQLSGKGPDGAYFEPMAVTPAADGTFEATITGLVEGNWRVQAIQPWAIATDFVGIPGAPDPGTDSVTPAQAAKEARKAWKQLNKQHAAALKQAFKSYKAAIKAARKALKGGADPAELLEDVYAALETLQLSIEAATNGAAGIGPTATATFGSTLDGLDQLVTEQLVGFGQSNDKVSARVDKRLAQRASQAVKVARSFAQTLAKTSDMRMAVDEKAVPFFRAAPVKGEQLSAPSAPLRFELLMGSSAQGVDADGVIRMRLSGDDTLGPRANLGLFGPDGFFLFYDIHAADLLGGLDLKFPADGPGDLAEGNYVAVLEQGSEVVSAAISVPGGD